MKTMQTKLDRRVKAQTKYARRLKLANAIYPADEPRNKYLINPERNEYFRQRTNAEIARGSRDLYCRCGICNRPWAAPIADQRLEADAALRSAE